MRAFVERRPAVFRGGSSLATLPARPVDVAGGGRLTSRSRNPGHLSRAVLAGGYAYSVTPSRSALAASGGHRSGPR